MTETKAWRAIFPSLDCLVDIIICRWTKLKIIDSEYDSSSITKIGIKNGGTTFLLICVSQKV